MARIWTSTLMVVILFLPTTGVAPAAAEDEPVIHMPFACGDAWTASTRFKVNIPAQDGRPAEKHPAHSPSPNAVDFNRPGDVGDPVYAGADRGSVVSVYRDAKDDSQNDANSGYGNTVVISYPGDVMLRFAHLDTVTISEDAPAGSVMANTQVGTVGSTGLGLGADGKPSTAYHLHYEQIAGGDVRLPVFEGVAWAVGTQIADDHDDLSNHPGIPNQSKNCTSDTSDPGPDSPPTGAPAVQWIEPVDGAETGSRLQLAAWPTPILVDGQLTDPTDVARVDFAASWSGGSAAACSAATADAQNLWTCSADLAAMDAPVGPVRLTFDVVRTDGSTLSAPDGSETVMYAGGSTKAVWVKKGTTKNASHVPYGERVALSARFNGDVDVAEVRFTAFYPDWPNAKDAAKLPGFDPKQTWRTLKICRPKTKGCTWEGDRQSATVSYSWNPTVREKKRSIQGVPKADPAISLKSKKCVPVTLGIDVVDASGTITSAPGGKIAQRCDAKAKGLARTVYLDPLVPPAAPGNVVERILSTRNIPDTDGFIDEVRVTWDDVSGEAGYRVYRRDFFLDLRQDARLRDCWDIGVGRPELLATVPADTTVFRYTYSYEGSFNVGQQYLVTAFNRSGKATGASREPTRSPSIEGIPRCK